MTFSQDPDNEDFIIIHGPYLQNIAPTEVTIVWSTNKPSVPGVNVSSGDGKIRFVRNSHDGIIDGGGLLHKVRVQGLNPGSSYSYSTNSVQILKYQAYKIFYGDTLQGKQMSFSTPPVKSEQVSFVVINDVHDNSGKMASYLKNVNIAESDFAVFNGDMVDYLQLEEKLFPGFIDTAVAYFASEKPFHYVRGNHETRGYKAREIKKYFDYKGDRFYYSFDYGQFHFIVLDCGEDKPDNNKFYYGLADYDSYRLEQLEWLKGEVNSIAFRDASKRIVLVHMPIIKKEKQGHGGKFLADNFGPLLNSVDIDLMISAHTHTNEFYDADKTGFGYPLLINSNNSFVEVVVSNKEIVLVVKDIDGAIIAEYHIK